MTAPSTNSGEPDIAQCLTEVQIDTCRYVSYYLTFVGPCIVIYFYSKTNQTHNISNTFYFWDNTLHVSDGPSVHHQESRTVHTASYLTGSVAACKQAATVPV